MKVSSTCSGQALCPVEWRGGKVKLIDQQKLPSKLVCINIESYKEMREAIRLMRVRGAPALGIASAYTLVLGAKGIKVESPDKFLMKLSNLSNELKAVRPTAVSVAKALDKMLETASKNRRFGIKKIKAALILQAKRIASESLEIEKKIGGIGSRVLKSGNNILTYCNAGALATAGYGTALGVIRTAAKKGKKIHVFVPETRPKLQGARLTAFELLKYGIPATLITDSMISHFMARGAIDKVLVGADRIALNGDTANKVGTYGIAVAAKEHGIPFYVVAPFNTIDGNIDSGEKIPIEERNPEEVTHIGGKQIAPSGVSVLNPAFDVTPRRYITGIITELGIIRPPYRGKIKSMMRE